MKRIPLYILVLFTLTSFQADISGPWIKTENGKIILFTRPKNYSKTVSPDSITIQKIINEQEKVINHINSLLKTNFDSKVEIYLYNFDEAKAKIGTNGGGFCSPRRRRIFFTYYDKPVYNTIRDTYEYIGVHEMTHLITRYELGKPKTVFFAEGYANAIDGNYGLIKKGGNLKRRNDSTLIKIIKHGTLLTPHELLYNGKISEREYYPQIGCLINWLFKEYGVDKINKLYNLNKNQIETKFYKVTGETFEEMEKKYLTHIKNQ